MMLRDILMGTAVTSAVFVSTPAVAVARSTEELNALASLRYQAAQTEAVAARLSDAKIMALRQQVSQSETALGAARGRLKAAQAAARQDKAVIADLGKTVESLLGSLAAEKTAFTNELAKRDAQYASDLAALQLAGEQLLATPEGLRALELYNAGGPGAFEAADTVLGEVEAARERARNEASLVQKAEDRRARARLALDARGRGLTTTAVAIERWEAVVDSGRPLVRDWANLVDLYLEYGRVTRARAAAAKGLALAKNDDERAIALGRVADALTAADDDAGALKLRREVLTLNRKAAADEPGSAEHLRRVSLVLRNVGYLQSATGDIAGARASTEEALRIDEQRLVLAPTLEVRREISADIGALADIDMTESNLAAEIARRKDVLARDRDILAADSQLLMSQSNLANSLLNLAGTERAYGRYRDALALLPEAMAMIDSLIAKDPASGEYLAQKVSALSEYQAILSATGEHQAAKQYNSEALSLARKNVEIDPEAPGPKWRLSGALVDLASHLGFDTEFEAKFALHSEALAIVRPLLDANPSPGAQEIVADRMIDVAWLNELMQRYGLALNTNREALDLLLLAERTSSALSIQYSLASVHGSMGNLAVKMGDTATAPKHAETAVGIRRKIRAIDVGRGGQTGLASSLSELGTAYQANGQFEQALAARREEIAIWRALLEGSQSPGKDREGLTGALLTAARTATLANDVPFTQASYREALDLLRRRDAEDPGLTREQLPYSLFNYATAPGTPADLKLSLLEERVGLLRGMNNAKGLAAALVDLARERRDGGDTSGALRDFAEWQKIFGEWITAEPDGFRDRANIAKVMLELARMAGTIDSWREAMAAIEAWRAAGDAFAGGDAMLREAQSHLTADAPAANQQSEGTEP